MKLFALLAFLLFPAIGYSASYTGYPSYGDQHWKAPVATSGALPTVGNSTGDVRLILNTFAVYRWNGTTWGNLVPAAVVGGPGSSTDNALARFDGTSGTQIQNSSATLSDGGTLSATAFSGPLTGNVTGNLTGNVTGNVTGNADTATALAANPSDCSANQFASAIAASGNLTCSAVGDGALSTSYVKADGSRALTASWNVGAFNITASTFIGALTGNAATATALASNPSDCGANAYATAIAASGDLTCGSVARAGVATGSANHVIINDGSGNLSSEAQLANSRGGTGQNMSASTGLVKVSSGTFSAATLVNADVSTSAAIAFSKLGFPSLIAKTGNYTLVATDDTVTADATGGAFTLTLPAAASNSGKIYTIKKLVADTSFTAVTVDGNASETIDGATTTTLNTQGESLRIQSDGTNWVILSRTIPQLIACPAFTPNNFGTIGTGGNAAQYKCYRKGRFLHVEYIFVAGTTAASLCSMSMATLNFDTANMVTTFTGSGGTAKIGDFRGGTTGSNQAIFNASGSGDLFYDGTDTNDFFFAYKAGVGYAKDNCSTVFNNGAGVWGLIDVPISGWNE